MYELTTQELMVFVVLGFCGGIFATYYLARLMEVIHLWRLAQQTVAHLILMCVKIVEDVAFLEEVKKQHMIKAEFTTEQIRQFQEVDAQTLTNWKDSVILSMVSRAPPHFRSLFPFKTWDDAMKFVRDSLKPD